jgi:hypothetical protein
MQFFSKISISFYSIKISFLDPEIMPNSVELESMLQLGAGL